MIQIRVVVLVLWIFKSGNFFLAHPVVEQSILTVLITMDIVDVDFRMSCLQRISIIQLV